jgi:hypothetical protein
MATPIEQPIVPIAPVAPVAPVVPVAPVAPVAPIETSVPAVSTALQTVTPSAVYAAQNIQQIDIPSQKKASDMKLSKLEDKLAKAKSIEELNQISIMNQPKAMGVISGEASYRSKLDTARLNSFNSLYNNRLEEEKRKEAKRQQFITTYGADPKQRPKGMSEREFSAALTAGKFQNLLTPAAKLAKAELASKLQSTALAAGGGSKGKLATVENATENAFRSFIQQNQGVQGYDQKVSPDMYLQARQEYVKNQGTAADFDARFGGYLSDQEKQNPTLGFAAGVGASPETVGAWADRITSGQAKLTEIPASQTALRNAVAVKLNEMGNSVEGKPTTTEMGKEALRSAEEIQGMIKQGQGTYAVGGSRFWGGGGITSMIPGTDMYNLTNKFNTLKDKLSLEAVKYLKGQGAVSDAERAMLKSAVTELNMNQSEEQFNKSLQQIMDKLRGGTPSITELSNQQQTTPSGFNYTVTYN